MDATSTTTPTRVVSLSKLKADVSRQDEGDWVKIPELDGVSVKVRSIRSAQYQAGAVPIREKHKRKYGENGAVPPEEFSSDYGRLVANVILLDWQGFDVEYERELAYSMLTDRGYAEVLGYIIAASGKVAQGEVEFVEAAAKN